MTVHVFVGPTLSAKDVTDRLPDAAVYPPVAHGDVLRVAPKAGDVVAIIDGLFFQSCAVRHKELLWLLAHDVRVVGASSMGALRAAELDRFGMRGVGQVYRGFASGLYTADDEVAVVHAEADDGWTPYTDPLVNLRAAAERAQEDGILSAEEAAGFVQVARQLFFSERRASEVLRRCRMSGLITASRRDDFATWLAAHEWNVKREDALMLLDELRNDTWLVRPRDADDWAIGAFPDLVHDWIRRFTPADPSGTSIEEVESLLRLYAHDAPAVVTDIGARAIRDTWLAESEDLNALCRARGLVDEGGIDDAFCRRFLNSAECEALGQAERISVALCRSVYATAGSRVDRPPYSPRALALAQDIDRFNRELEQTATNFRPEFIAPSTVDRYFRDWWATDDLDVEARRRGFATTDDYRLAARRSLAYAASQGAPTLRWKGME